MRLNIPKNIEELMKDLSFLNQFIEEIHCIFGIGIDEFSGNNWFHHESTSGWVYAFMNACIKTNKIELIEYYRSLNVDESDGFDDILLTTLEEKHLILNGFADEEIEKELHLEKNTVYECMMCGHFFKKEDMTEDEEGFLYGCKKCEENVDVKPVNIDILKRLKKELNLNETDVFYCKQCGHYHLIKFKTDEDICRYCKIQNESESKNANNYYKQVLKDVKEFKAQHFTKIQ